MAAAKGTILVTGANGGLGSAVAEHIASSPELSTNHGVYTVRDATSAPTLTSALARGALMHHHDILSLDLTKLDNVRQVAEDINVSCPMEECYQSANLHQARVAARSIPPIRALILNAGFQEFGNQSWTDNGLDVTFAANYLGHWLLVLLLLKSMDKEAGRIIIIGSQAHE